MRTFIVMLIAALLATGFARAGLDVAPTSNDLSAYPTREELTAALPVRPTAYTVATLPDPTENRAKYAFVTDLGGGRDMVLSDGVNWKRIRRGYPVALTAASQTIDPLRSGSIVVLPAGTLTQSLQYTVATANLYPGYELTVVNPGTLGVGGGIGLGLEGQPVAQFLPVAGQRWVDFVYDPAVGTLRVVRSGNML